MTLVKFRDKVCELPDGGKGVLRLAGDNSWTMFKIVNEETKELAPEPVWSGKDDAHAIALLSACVPSRVVFY